MPRYLIIQCSMKLVCSSCNFNYFLLLLLVNISLTTLWSIWRLLANVVQCTPKSVRPNQHHVENGGVSKGNSFCLHEYCWSLHNAEVFAYLFVCVSIIHTAYRYSYFLASLSKCMCMRSTEIFEHFSLIFLVDFHIASSWKLLPK